MEANMYKTRTVGKKSYCLSKAFNLICLTDHARPLTATTTAISIWDL
jgi:hypothetical protein